ncbi:MAG: hypothetical protein LBL62_04945 [Planctomycetaceae bacterium]|jgi:hypothetical protein|nr:hypothetical protein [Planctomycetaceae bacterium]
MAEMENTNQTVRQVYDNLYEIIKDMTLEERCRYIFEHVKELHQKWRNDQPLNTNNETPKT